MTRHFISTMLGWPMFPRLAAAICLVSITPLAFAFEATVVDKSKQEVVIKDLKINKNNTSSANNASSVFLGVKAQDWILDIHLSKLKELKLNEGAKKEDNAGIPHTIPFTISLISGKPIEAEWSETLTGDTDFGKAQVACGNLTSATFEKQAGDTEFQPSADTRKATVTDARGKSYVLSAVTFGLDNKLTGTRGSTTLTIDPDNVQKIETVGKVKEQNVEQTKYHIYLANDKDTELIVNASMSVKGDFELGTAQIPLNATASIVFEKKSK